MKKYLLLAAVLLGCAYYSNAQQAKKPVKPVKKAAVVDTFCYMAIEDGGKTKNTIRLTFVGNKVEGEIRYYTEGQKMAEGVLDGTIKDSIITADWIFKKDKDYLKIPVCLKFSPQVVWQKPSAVNEKGEGYIPADAKFVFKFPRIECKEYPFKPLIHPKDKIKITIR